MTHGSFFSAALVVAVVLPLALLVGGYLVFEGLHVATRLVRAHQVRTRRPER